VEQFRGIVGSELGSGERGVEIEEIEEAAGGLKATDEIEENRLA
jgi:hypothetical protein